MVIVCPFTVDQYGDAVTCHGDACRMWNKGDCVIRTGMIAFTELMFVLSEKAEVK